MTSDTHTGGDSGPSGETIFGHPKGLAFLALTEAWERFSFYGMRALLVLYMVQELLLPGHIENVAGIEALRNALESLTGPLSTQAFASQIFGFYAGLVYFTPLFGGIIADRWLGAKKTVMIGIILMAIGHFAMAFEQSVLIALLLLVLGSGCLKGNIAAQVGHLYPRHDEARRTRGFAIFSTGINIGAVIGPVVCGLLAQLYGWHIGFGTAGIFMIIAAATYFAGMRHFAEERAHSLTKDPVPPMESRERRLLLLVVVVLLLSLFQFLAYDQIFNVGMIWVSEAVNLSTPVGTVPVPWFTSLDSLASVLVVPLLIILWRAQAKRGKEPGDLGKMAVGAALMGTSMAMLALGSWLADNGMALILFPILAFTLSGIAFMWTWPTMLALVSRRAPAKVNAFMMATVYLTAFVTGIGSGFVAMAYEPLGATWFWLMNSAIALCGSLAILMFGPALKRAMDALEEPAAAPAQ